MNLGILITDFQVKKAVHTTIRLAREMSNRGHRVTFVTPGDFAYGVDDRLALWARVIEPGAYPSNDQYFEVLLGTTDKVRTEARDLDILLLRDNPAKYSQSQSWARTAGTSFGLAAVREGVLVLNDPGGLARAQNKLYFQYFPREVRATTLITRDRSEVKAFARDLEGDMILKPLQGSGGDNVFLVRKDANYNLNQLLDTLNKEGYLVAQEYLAAASEGDVRLFLMNGRPLQVDGRYAAFRRVRQGEDIRSNLHAGGRVEAAELTPEMLRISELIRPKLVEDGMFLVGLDMVGDRLMEVNLFCPGGLQGMEDLQGANFTRAVAEELERKHEVAAAGGRKFDNRLLATDGPDRD